MKVVELVLEKLPSDRSVTLTELVSMCIGELDPASCCRLYKGADCDVSDMVFRGARKRIRNALGLLLRKGVIESRGDGSNRRYARPGVMDGDVGVVRKTKPYKQAVLEMLRNGPVYTSQLRRSARPINQLRLAGYEIHARNVNGSEWQYTLIDENAVMCNADPD